MKPTRLAAAMAVAVAVAVLAAVLWVLGAGPAAAHAGVTTAPPVIVVDAGDTLWDIALKYYPGRDPRRVVDRIRRQNGLDQAVIFEGQVLRLDWQTGTERPVAAAAPGL